MRIKEVNSDTIVFDNGKVISFDHNQDCCEYNYADFSQIDDLARDYDFEDKLKFEKCEDYGFMFGDNRRMFFIPCYSKQNGYYSNDVDIYYDGNCVLTADGEGIDC